MPLCRTQVVAINRVAVLADWIGRYATAAVIGRADVAGIGAGVDGIAAPFINRVVTEEVPVAVQARTVTWQMIAAPSARVQGRGRSWGPGPVSAAVVQNQEKDQRAERDAQQQQTPIHFPKTQGSSRGEEESPKSTEYEKIPFHLYKR